MSSFISSTPRLVRCGVYMQILGVLVFSVTMYVLAPPVMIACMPLGGGLILLGWLAWLTAFLRDL